MYLFVNSNNIYRKGHRTKISKTLPIVVSHYTDDTGYKQEVQKLIGSLHRWNLPYDIEPISSLGSWRANSNYCSVLVANMLKKYPEDDILRVDADAIFQRFPELFLEESFDFDIAAHIANFRWHPNELLGGTIFFHNTPTVRQVVDEWVLYSTKVRPNDRNGDILQDILNSGKYPVRFGQLPASYCKIFDIMSYVENPVIEHFQASRRFKHQVNHRNKTR